MADERAEKLGAHLRRLVNPNDDTQLFAKFFVKQAESIVADPQGHVDALDEAGVVVLVGTLTMGTTRYEVVIAHPSCEHEWRVTASGTALIWLTCRTCGEQRGVPNRLPIEVPES